MRWGEQRLLVGFVALVVLAGCGARVSDAQRAQAAGATRGAPVAAGDGGQQAAGGPSTTAAGGGPVTTAAGAASTPAGASPTTAAPAGGNGGATDVGVTANQITLGNISTLSGPVPGLFQGAVIGTQAFIAYQNSQGGIFGRS